jgi:hypothetical protein
MDQLFVEFEIYKIVAIAAKHYLILKRQENEKPLSASLSVFDVYDECLDCFQRIATMQWVEGRWALIPLDGIAVASVNAIDAMLAEAKSPYFWKVDA